MIALLLPKVILVDEVVLEDQQCHRQLLEVPVAVPVEQEDILLVPDPILQDPLILDGGGEGGDGRSCPHFPGPVIANALPADYDRYPRGGTCSYTVSCSISDMRINRTQMPVPVAGPPYSVRRGPAYALNKDNPSVSNVRTLKQSFIDAVGPTGLYGGGGGGSRGPNPQIHNINKLVQVNLDPVVVEEGHMPHPHLTRTVKWHFLELHIPVVVVEEEVLMIT